MLVESECVELKKSTGELKQAIISMVAMLNKHQKDNLYFGIKDNGESVGQQIFNQTIRDVSKIISESIEPKIYPTVSRVIIQDKECIHVGFEGSDLPYFAFGRAYMRVGDEDTQLTQKEIKNIVIKIEEKNNRWEERESNIDLEDIDEDTLKKFVRKGIKKGRITFEYTNKGDILRKLNLITEKGKVKNAGYVLFGKEPFIQLRVAIFATNEKTTFLDMQDFKGNIFRLIDSGEQYIAKNIRWSANFNTGFFTDEATPQDYIMGQEPSRPRNPLIAQTIYLSGEIEKSGSGIKNVYNMCNEDKIQIKFENRKTAFFVVVYRKDLDGLVENTKKKLNKNVPVNETVSGTISGTINGTLKVILQQIKIKPNITQPEISGLTGIPLRTVKRNINKLKEMDLIERIGSRKIGYWKIK